MIVSVCADKGSPGVSDLATVLAVVWPGRRIVLEADCAGADLPFRLRHADGDRLLDAQPSVLSLAADCRGALPDGGLVGYAQPTTLGVPVVPGALSAEGFAPMARLWPQVAAAASGWDGMVIADLGRYQPGNAAAALARASTAVLLLARPDLPGLYHLRDRVGELAASLGDPSQDRHPVAVVVRARAGSAGRAALQQVRQVLAAAGSPVPVAGLFADDPAAITLLRQGVLSRRLLGSDLVRSAQALAATLIGWWPHLAAGPAATSAAAPSSTPAAVPALQASGVPAAAVPGAAGRFARLRPAGRPHTAPAAGGPAVGSAFGPVSG